MQQNQRELIEDRVDWLTATTLIKDASGQDQVERAIVLGSDLLRASQSEGNDLRRWKWMGFEGYTAGKVAVGKNNHGLIFRLSSDKAAAHYKEVVEVATNVSRVDCAATVRLNGAWSDLSREHHAEALAYQREHNPRLRVTRIDGGKHGCSLTVGSRSSNSYGRIYDKHAESKDEAYRDCWRYEVEFKSDDAKFVAMNLAENHDAGVTPAAICGAWFRRRHIALRQFITGSPLRRSSQLATDDHRRLCWFRSHVRRTVIELLSRGHRDAVLDALGLSQIASGIKGEISPSLTEESEVK